MGSHTHTLKQRELPDGRIVLECTHEGCVFRAEQQRHGPDARLAALQAGAMHEARHA